MSAFIVDQGKINKVVSWIWRERLDSPHLYRTLEEMGYRNGTDWAFLLGRDMWRLNFDAVSYKYNSKENLPGPKGAERNIYDFKMSVAPSDIQVLKFIQGWLYQCCEGDYPNDPLYKFFDEVVKVHLLEKIVGELPEYKNAEWVL